MRPVTGFNSFSPAVQFTSSPTTYQSYAPGALTASPGTQNIRPLEATALHFSIPNRLRAQEMRHYSYSHVEMSMGFRDGELWSGKAIGGLVAEHYFTGMESIGTAGKTDGRNGIEFMRTTAAEFGQVH